MSTSRYSLKNTSELEDGKTPSPTISEIIISLAANFNTRVIILDLFSEILGNGISALKKKILAPLHYFPSVIQYHFVEKLVQCSANRRNASYKILPITLKLRH